MQNEMGADRLDGVRSNAVVSAVSVSEVLDKLVSKGMPQMLAAASLGDRCFLACARKYGTGWTADHDLARIGSNWLPPLTMFR